MVKTKQGKMIQKKDQETLELVGRMSLHKSKGEHLGTGTKKKRSNIFYGICAVSYKPDPDLIAEVYMCVSVCVCGDG